MVGLIKIVLLPLIVRRQGAGQQAVGGAVQGAEDALHCGAGAEGADPADRGHDSLRSAHSSPGAYYKL
jgi:hypothetical protein